MKNRIAGGEGFVPLVAGNGGPKSRRETSHLRELYNFVLRNRALVLLVPAVVVAATLVFVYLATPVYDAAAWIRVDEERSTLPVLDALQSVATGDQIHTEMAVLLRRPVAEAVVDSLGLQLMVTEPDRVPRRHLLEEIRVSRDAPEGHYRLAREDGQLVLRSEAEDRELGRYAVGEPVSVAGASFVVGPGAPGEDEIAFTVRRFTDALTDFRRTLEVTRPDRDADLIRIRYQGTDSLLVASVPNAVAGEFIQLRRTERATEATSTVEFLEDQIGLLAGQLRTAEEDLKRFREANRIVSLEQEAEANVEHYAQLRAERDRIQAEREALSEMLMAAAAADAADGSDPDPLAPSPYRDLIAFPTLFSNFSVSELFRSMAEVENQRAQLLNLRRPEDPDVQVLTERIGELEEQLRKIAVTYHEGLGQQAMSFDRRLAEYQVDLREVPEKEIQHARLFRNAEVLEEIHTMLQTRLKEAQIAAAVKDPTVRVVEPAVVPVAPIRPNKPLSLVLALLLGVGLGAGLAFLRENMDTSIHTREDLQEVAPGLPVLGLIPRIEEAAVNGDRRVAPVTGAGRDLSHRLVAGRDPRSPIAEAYRSLRTSIAFSGLEAGHRRLVFTSALPGDGKSTSSANLAITLAQQGQRCLLVDADMRKGVLHEVFGELRIPGLSDVLLEKVDLTEAVRRIDLGESGSLDFLASGTLPPNPAELISSKRTERLLGILEDLYDTVILDAPPLNLVTDAALLGSYADGVVVIARSGVTDRGAVSYALEQLASVNAPLLGAVLNDIDVRKDRYYGSYGLVSYERYAAEVGDKVRT